MTILSMANSLFLELFITHDQGDPAGTWGCAESPEIGIEEGHLIQVTDETSFLLLSVIT
jgi:hypothetical protein